MLNTEMHLINQAFFYEQMQQAQKERLEHQRRWNRGHQSRSHRFLNVRSRVGALLITVGQRLQTFDSAYAEPTA